jgi:hypothetical protein
VTTWQLLPPEVPTCQRPLRERLLPEELWTARGERGRRLEPCDVHAN